MSTPQGWSPKNHLQTEKKIIHYGLPIVINGRVDHAAQIHFLNSLPMTSKVEKKGDSDDDMYDMLENMQAM